MQLLVDSAEINLINEALATGYVRGVTTNPTLLRRAGLRADEVPALVERIIEAGAQEIHLQTYAPDQAGMLREAHTLFALDSQRVVIKLPATHAGYAAAAKLQQQNIPVTLTAVYTLRQALAAANVGAKYIAVYLGRMQDEGLDALATIGAMQQMLDTQKSSVQILAASIRDIALIETLAAMGVGAATIAPPVLADMLVSPSTERAVEVFTEDARAIQAGTS